jgi:hypothetical protein
MSAAQEDALWRVVGQLEGEVAEMRQRCERLEQTQDKPLIGWPLAVSVLALVFAWYTSAAVSDFARSRQALYDWQTKGLVCARDTVTAQHGE